MEVKPAAQDNMLIIPEKDIVEIRTKYQPDVCIRLGFENVFCYAATCAVHGMWAHEFGIAKPGIHPDAMVWDVMQNNCTTKIAIRRYTGSNQHSEIIYQSFSTAKMAVRRCLNEACWKAASFMPRKLKELYERSEVAVIKQNENNSQPGDPKKMYLNQHPVNTKFTAFLIKGAAAIIKKKIAKRFYFDQWKLLYSLQHKQEFPNLSFGDKKELLPPKDRFWADPFVYTANGKHYFFVEELFFQKKKAHLSVIEANASTGVTTAPVIILEKPYHLSYPLVFESNNQLYMLPETSANKTIELYRCKKFPGEWQFVMNLMQGLHAVDSTIYFYNDKYWLFTSMKENAGASARDELYLFFADALETNQWHAHPQNPVVSDVRKARPAGRIFNYNGKIYRPSQDGSCKYGYATNINEITALTETQYAETTVQKILPEWNDKVTGTHNLDFTQEIAVIDATERRRR